MNRKFSRYGMCSACTVLKELEGHHIIPQRYEKGTTNSLMLYLCHSCHRDLHDNWIDPLGNISRSEFVYQTRQFLWEKRS